MSDENPVRLMDARMALEASKIWIELSCELTQLSCDYFDRCGRLVEAALRRMNAGGLR